MDYFHYIPFEILLDHDRLGIESETEWKKVGLPLKCLEQSTYITAKVSRAGEPTGVVRVSWTSYERRKLVDLDSESLKSRIS